MAKEPLLKQIVAELEKAKKPASFCTSGAFDFGDSQISVAGIVQIKLPIRTGDIRKLCDVAVQAPYGKRSETIVDREVRDTLEIPAHDVSCSDEFAEKMNAAVKSIASELHLDHERLECELYKLLIYTKGGFFLPHRDSEKKKGMVASLVVVLPNKFNGGELVVQHDGRSFRFAFEAARSLTKAEFVAFFADCKHEVKKVTSGIRVCLTFNLMLKDASKPKSSKDSLKSNAKLRNSIEGWIAHRAEKPIVFALEHLYTSDGLVPQLLKGADSILFEELVPVANDLGCSLHFGQVSRHLCQFADDAIAIEKLVTQLKCLTTGDYRTRSEPPTSAWLQLILACLNGGDESQPKELLQLADEFPKIFELREVQVPAAIKLKAWKGSASSKMPKAVVNWVESVRQKLKVATRAKPQLPDDESRSANMNCKCEYCNQLRDFLLDSEQSQIEIKAAEHYRNHMESTIRSQSLDLTSKKIRVGNRYALRFFKTTASYQLALNRYEDDLKLLAKFESA